MSYHHSRKEYYIDLVDKKFDELKITVVGNEQKDVTKNRYYTKTLPYSMPFDMLRVLVIDALSETTIPKCVIIEALKREQKKYSPIYNKKTKELT